MKDQEALIEAIQTSGVKACIVMAGGGSSAAEAILAHPGASRFVIDVQIPYSQKAFIDYLNCEPESFCSELTASKLAVAAFKNAMYFEENSSVIGIACTAGIATNRVRRGEDRAFVSITNGLTNISEKFTPTSDGRQNQEAELKDFILNMIAKFVGVLDA